MEDSGYTKVSCTFYDELEVLAVSGKISDISFLDDRGAHSRIRARIRTLFSTEGVEYLKTDSGLQIRLDRIAEIDGKSPWPTC